MTAKASKAATILMIVAAAISAHSVVVEKRPAITLTGIVTDSLCGADHGIKALGDPECTRTCVELGAQYALAVGRKLYVVQGHQAELERFAGNDVRVKGHTAGRDTVIVDQVDRLYAEAAGMK